MFSPNLSVICTSQEGNATQTATRRRDCDTLWAEHFVQQSFTEQSVVTGGRKAGFIQTAVIKGSKWAPGELNIHKTQPGLKSDVKTRLRGCFQEAQ